MKRINFVKYKRLHVNQAHTNKRKNRFDIECKTENNDEKCPNM